MKKILLILILLLFYFISYAQENKLAPYIGKDYDIVTNPYFTKREINKLIKTIKKHCDKTIKWKFKTTNIYFNSNDITFKDNDIIIIPNVKANGDYWNSGFPHRGQETFHLHIQKVNNKYIIIYSTLK